MATMNISLPDQLKTWIEAEAERKHFSNVSDFMRDLARKAKEQADHDAWLCAEIDKGLKAKSKLGSIDTLFAEAKQLAAQRMKKAKAS